MQIRELRLNKGLTQIEASEILGMNLRTYQNYESGKSHRDSFKINQIVKILSEYERYTPTKGILPMEYIQEKVNEVCSKYNIYYVYMFGSYAKGYQTEKSDVDLFIDTDAKGLDYVGIMEEFYEALHKEVDVLSFRDVVKNPEFFREILRTGIKLYGGN